MRILLLVVYRKRSIYNNKYDTYSQLSSILEVALGDFLTDLAHELYKLVKELAKNKKD